MDFGHLIKALEAESEVYKKFTEVQGEKTTVITDGDIEKLDAILNVEQGLHMKIQNLEKARVAAIKDLGLEKKTLLDVIKLSEGEPKAALTKLFHDLNNYISELKQLNEYNTKLVESRLEIVTAVNSLYFMETGTVQPSGSAGKMAVYGKDAKVSRQPEGLERAVVRKKM